MNKTLFGTPSNVPATITTNDAGGVAYALSDKQALAQLACTNTFNGTFYADAKATLDKSLDVVLRLTKSDPAFVAKLAIYSRHNGYMKDMPAFLCVVLGELEDSKYFHKVFDAVIDNGKMLRNVIQIARSGVCGKKKNVGNYRYRLAVNRWFRKDPPFIFGAIIGNEPTLKDILSLTHPKPATETHNALFDYIRNGYGKYPDALPQIVKDYEAFKRKETPEVPKVDFRLLDALGLNDDHWLQIAMKASWHQTRMNLNTFERHNVFKSAVATQTIAARLRDANEVRRAKVFPYQLMMAYLMTDDVPQDIRLALQDAMEIATENVPKYEGQVHIGVDVSGSMSSPITGSQGTATSKVRCIDVAALFASSILRSNNAATVLPFDTSVHKANLNTRDSIMTNAEKLASYGGGGTDCSLPLAHLNKLGAFGDTVIYVSDNESWCQYGRVRWGISGRGTGLQQEWEIYKRRNPKAKLVLIDIEPQITSQATDSKDILRVGGFSDSVFDVVNSFLTVGSIDHWVKTIDEIEL